MAAAEPATRKISWPCGGPLASLLPQLPGARAEAADVVAGWKAADRPGEARLLSGAAATEETFKLEAPGSGVIHLATHGIVVGDTCARAEAGTRGVGGVAPVSRARAARARNAAPKPAPPPLVGRQVWLALAGADHAAEALDENDGLLTAEEVVTLDLRGAGWVVLSACQSGVGEAWAREGLLGMRRAFALAGARSVIASQWPVADEATREWMRALYRSRRTTLSTGENIRSACRSVLAARRRRGRTTHPFYWAAFTATGE